MWSGCRGLLLVRSWREKRVKRRRSMFVGLGCCVQGIVFEEWSEVVLT